MRPNSGDHTLVNTRGALMINGIISVLMEVLATPTDTWIDSPSITVWRDI